MVLAGLVLLVQAFQQSILWGLGYLLIPFVALIFVFAHWDRAKSPFLWSIIGLGVVVLAIVVGGGMVGSANASPQ